MYIPPSQFNTNSWYAKAFTPTRTAPSGKGDYDTTKVQNNDAKLVYDHLKVRTVRQLKKRGAVAAVVMAVGVVFMGISWVPLALGAPSAVSVSVLTVGVFGGAALVSSSPSAALVLFPQKYNRLSDRAHSDKRWKSEVDAEVARLRSKGQAQAATALKNAHQAVLEADDEL